MIKIDYQQGSPEWLKWRRGGIGSSDISKIMGVSPYGTALDVYNEKTGIAEEKKQNLAMKRGTNFESEARQSFCKLIGKAFVPDQYQRIDYSFIRASLDGYNEDHKEILEIKVPKQKEIDQAFFGEIPEHYMYQMQWQMHVVSASRGYFVCYNPNTREMPCVTIARDDELIKKMVIQSIEFWENFLRGIPPGQQEKDIDYFTDPHLMAEIEKYRALKLRQAILNVDLEDSKTRIVGYAQGRSFKCSGLIAQKTKGKKTYDMDAMKSDGIDIERYAKTGKESWVIKIDK